MTYTPQVFINDYYSRDPRTGTNSVGIDSMPRSNAEILRSFDNSSSQFNSTGSGIVFSVAIKPQINLLNLKYLDFYGGSSSATNPASFKWEIKQANISGSSLGGSVTSGMILYSTGSGVTSISTTAQNMGVGLTKYQGEFTDAFNLYAGNIYYVDCVCTVTAGSGVTTNFVGTNLGTTNESFYRDKVTISGSGTNLATTAPHVTIPSSYAGMLYAGMRVVHSTINSGNGANITTVNSATTFTLDTAPASASTSTTIYAYDLSRSIASGTGTFTGTTEGKPNIVDFVPFIRIRGQG